MTTTAEDAEAAALEEAVALVVETERVLYASFEPLAVLVRAGRPRVEQVVARAAVDAAHVAHAGALAGKVEAEAGLRLLSFSTVVPASYVGDVASVSFGCRGRS